MICGVPGLASTGEASIQKLASLQLKDSCQDDDSAGELLEREGGLLQTTWHADSDEPQFCLLPSKAHSTNSE